jgi:hypothetical protein
VAYKVAHVQIPDPPTMPQDGQQILRFSGTIQAVSPYDVPRQTLTVLLPSTDIHELSEPQASGSAKVSGMKVLYTGLKNTGAFQVEPLELRYRSDYMFIHFLSVDRVITVCASPIVPFAFLKVVQICRCVLLIQSAHRLQASDFGL